MCEMAKDTESSEEEFANRYDFWHTVEAGDIVRDLRDSGLLTEQQAMVYAYRELVQWDRRKTAEKLGTSPSNVDNLLARAREKVQQARETVDVLEDVGYPFPPGAFGRVNRGEFSIDEVSDVVDIVTQEEYADVSNNPKQIVEVGGGQFKLVRIKE